MKGSSPSHPTAKMFFRRTRPSNDGHSWLSCFLSVVVGLGAFAIAIAASSVDSIFLKVLTTALSVLCAIAFAWSVRTNVFPYEWEMVVDDDSIRWGQTLKPERQQHLSVQKMKRLIYDKSDNKVLADVGKFRLLPIAEEVLVRSDDHAALVEYLRENFPQLTIEIT